MATIPSALDIPLGDVVRAWRAHRGLSVTEFAARTGIPKAYISELEHRKIATPGKKRMSQLATGLGIDYWSLVQRQMPPMDSGDDEQAAPARHAGGFSFASPMKSSLSTPGANLGDEARLLQQLSDQVDGVRRTLDALLAKKASNRQDFGAS
jgi:transcriptional regulator with XRE-family HTH domain